MENSRSGKSSRTYFWYIFVIRLKVIPFFVKKYAIVVDNCVFLFIWIILMAPQTHISSPFHFY